MPYKPGQSGNPKGRPKKDRALTSILERAGGATVEIEGIKISGRRLLARQIWEGLTTGTITFPENKKMTLSPQDWKDFAKWVFTHIDGPPQAKIDVTSGGEKIAQKEENAERFDRAILALADAVRETVSGEDAKQNSSLDTSE